MIVMIEKADGVIFGEVEKQVYIEYLGDGLAISVDNNRVELEDVTIHIIDHGILLKTFESGSLSEE